MKIRSQLKVGLALTSLLILLSIVCLQYDIIKVSTVRDLLLMPCFVFAGSLFFLTFKKDKKSQS